METDVLRIEVLCQERVRLFQRLLDCVTTEKDNLIELNINQLWSLMEEKEEIIEYLEESRSRMGECIDLDDPYSSVPEKHRRVMMGFFQKIEHLKREVRQKVKENVALIQDSLDFFHDLVSVFATSGLTENTYHQVKGPGTEAANILYYREA